MDSVAPEGWLQMVGAVSQSAGGVETRHDRSRGGGKLSPGCRRLPPLGRPPCPLLLASPAGPIDYWEGWGERVRLKLIKPIVVHGCQAISNDACIGGGDRGLGVVSSNNSVCPINPSATGRASNYQRRSAYTAGNSHINHLWLSHRNVPLCSSYIPLPSPS